MRKEDTERGASRAVSGHAGSKRQVDWLRGHRGLLEIDQNHLNEDLPWVAVTG